LKLIQKQHVSAKCRAIETDRRQTDIVINNRPDNSTVNGMAARF